MKPQDKTVAVLVTGLVLVALAFGLYILVRASGAIFADLDPGIGRPLLIASAVVLLSALIVARGASQRPARVGSMASEKAEVYQQLLTLLSERGSTTASTAVTLQDVERRLVLLARKSVLDRYLALRAFGPHGDTDDPNVEDAIRRLVVEIRRDLGHRDGPLTPEGMAKLALARSPSQPAEVVPALGESVGSPQHDEAPSPPSRASDPRAPKAGEFRVADSL